MSTIPVVDFMSCCGVDASDEAKKTMGKRLIDVLSDTGFVYLRNHGISSSSIDSVNDVTRMFFESPLEMKNQYTKTRSLFGYVGVQEERLDPTRYPGYKEMFNVSGGFFDSVDDSQWPDALSPTFSKTIKSFMEQCKDLALKLLDILSIGLELEEDCLRKCHSLMHHEGNHTALRTLYYPPLPEDMSAIDTRLVEHSDYGSITLLFQDDVGGLQVQCTNGCYIEATPIQDTVLVNIGDALQFWTGGKLKSTKHKVELPTDIRRCKSVRRSIAYFVNPNNDVRFDQVLLGQDKTRNIKSAASATEKPVSFFEYLDTKISNAFAHPFKGQQPS